jgi:hypothetical protein
MIYPLEKMTSLNIFFRELIEKCEKRILFWAHNTVFTAQKPFFKVFFYIMITTRKCNPWVFILLDDAKGNMKPPIGRSVARW